MPNRFILHLLFVLTFIPTAATAQKMPREDVIDVPAIGDGLCVSNVFQSNMVLQRDKPIDIWGWAKPGQTITVSMGDDSSTATSQQDRKWKVTLPPRTAQSEPLTIKVATGDQVLSLENVLVGDVWVLGGQSNMEFPLDRVENGQLEIVSANYPNIRILTVPAADGPDEAAGFPRLHEWSSWFGRHFRKGDWDECRPEIARELSAIGHVFARRIHTASRIPIGIIDASRGGTTVETWTPDSVLRQMESPRVESLLNEWDQKVADWDPEADLKQRQLNFQNKVARFKKEGRKLSPNDKVPTDLRPGPSVDQNRPGNCYASMIAPVAGLQVKGVIFHQGYNNCFNGTSGAKMYAEIFPKMISSWRNAFNDPELPFGVLSLCTEGPVQTLDNYSELMCNVGPYIREAQYQTFLDMYQSGDENIGFVSTYDLRRRWYHPQLKVPAGERIARWALATEYGLEGKIRWKPPIVESLAVNKGNIIVRFDEAVGGVDDGSPIVGFAIAGSDRCFHPAEASFLVTGQNDRGQDKTDNRAIVLSSPMVPEPFHYRYAWGRSPLGNLQASRQTDIPVATQRSDDWPLEAIPAGVLEDVPEGKADRRQRQQLLNALRELDLNRRKQAARELLELGDE